MDYRANAAAKAVSTGRFATVGLLLSTTDWKSHLPSELLGALTRTLAEHDLRLSVCSLPDATLTDRDRLPLFLRSLHADGFLIKYDTAIPTAMQELLAGLGAPLVWINSRQKADCVLPDEEQAGRLATGHLLDLGHRRIAFLDFFPRDPDNHYSSSARAAGYAAAMTAAGLRPRLVNQRIVPLHERLAVLDVLLRNPDRPTAIVASDGDEEALLVQLAARIAGLDMPRDLSLVAIHGRVLRQLALTITTALRPSPEVGQAAVAMLMQALAAPRKRQDPRLVPFTLDTGKTTAHPAR